MTEPAPDAVTLKDPAELEPVPKARWPLSYCLQPPKPAQSSLQAFGIESDKRPPRRWWSYRLYRGPGGKEVQILYSRTKAQSEIVAQHFVNEPILGFDLEWPWNDWKKSDLQNKVGLIQIASEDKIGLFHIGLHPGKTTDDIIAPTLRHIIETPTIGKVGVSILKADFSRLNRYFGLKPQGAIEASHLYRLVKFGGRKPELVSVKFVSLANQVEDQLGLPLYKGDVRTSNWSKPLSKDQINYAASDAYAGFMLYHCTNAKRLAMHPTPPLPIYAERYPRGKASRDDPILLDAGDGTTITTEAFFGVKPAQDAPSEGNAKAQKLAEAAERDKARVPVLDSVAQALFDKLLVRRADIAERTHIQAKRVLPDTLLAAIAIKCPRDIEGLLSIKGIGKVQVEKYGSAWLEVITLFLATSKSEQAAPVQDPKVSNASGAAAVQQPPLTPRRTRNPAQSSPNSSPAFASPPPRTPQLHTGLSFTLAETTIAENDNGSGGGTSSSNSNDSLQSIDFGSPTRRRRSGQKRKRTESPTKEEPKKTSQRLQQCTHDFSRSPVNLSQYIHKPTAVGLAPQAAISPTAISRKTTSIKDVFAAAPSAPVTTSAPITTSTPIATSAPITASSTTPHPPPPNPPQPPTLPLSPHSCIARNKLLAFSRLVTRKLPNRSPTAPPLVTEHTLALLVKRAPTTQQELERIPGVDGLLLACERTGTDCLKNVIKFIGKASSS